MLATSTHDTKRSEDVRARLNVLSEMPRLWAAQVMRWRRFNRPRKRAISDGRVVPDPNEEYLLYQTLIGAWPLPPVTADGREAFIDRINAYMTKALHEAKVNLSWVNQNPEYIRALDRFIERILRPGTASRPNEFLRQFEAFIPTIAFFGALNSVAQLLLKIAAPGVPDIYRGTEIWDLSLVDPDNRRPVDYAVRSEMLNNLLSRAEAVSDLPGLCRELVANYHDGRLKIWTMLRAMNFRRDHRDIFGEGNYVPLRAKGDAEDHVVAFAREKRGMAAITVVPRFTYTLMRGQSDPPLGNAWKNTEIFLNRPRTDFVNIFTGQILRTSSSGMLLCREVFADFPVSLLGMR
jgi:(1->4)-alpha-D-glucan 1-alpha-D-glucosylmutase